MSIHENNAVINMIFNNVGFNLHINDPMNINEDVYLIESTLFECVTLKAWV